MQLAKSYFFTLRIIFLNLHLEKETKNFEVLKKYEFQKALKQKKLFSHDQLYCFLFLHLTVIKELQNTDATFSRDMRTYITVKKLFTQWREQRRI